MWVTRRRAFAVLVTGVLTAGGLVAAPPTARATTGATITVTTTADDNSVNGNCSLREALHAANSDTTVDACPAGNGADTIALGAHTYDVHDGWLNAQSTVAIQGVAAASTSIDDTGTTCATCGRTFLVAA